MQHCCDCQHASKHAISVFSARAKHTGEILHFARECVMSKEVVFKDNPTNQMGGFMPYEITSWYKA
jgi:hypothetical protein